MIPDAPLVAVPYQNSSLASNFRFVLLEHPIKRFELVRHRPVPYMVNICFEVKVQVLQVWGSLWLNSFRRLCVIECVYVRDS